METHSSILACIFPWTEEPGGLQSMGYQRVGHDWVTYTTIQCIIQFCIICIPHTGEGNGNPLQYSCLENPMDGGACQATVHGVAKSGTHLSSLTFTFIYYIHICKHLQVKYLLVYTSKICILVKSMSCNGCIPHVSVKFTIYDHRVL